MTDIIPGLHRVHEARLLLHAVAGKEILPEDQIPEDATSLLHVTHIAMCTGPYCLQTTVESTHERPVTLKDGLGFPVNVRRSVIPTIAVRMCEEHTVNLRP